MASFLSSLRELHLRTRSHAGRGNGRRVAPAGRPHGLPWWLLSAPILGFLALPLLALLLRTSPLAALRDLGQPEVYQAVLLSLQTSLVATGCTLLLGTPVAFLLARHTFPLKRVVDALVDLPMVLPPAVAGVALLMAFGRRGLLGGVLDAMGLQLTFTPVAVVMAQTFVAAPLFIRAAVIGFSSVEPEMEEAALIDGAGSWQVLRRVTLPLARTALLGGVVLTWARALGEFGATIIFAGNLPGRTQTMPLAIYLGFELDLSVALTLSVILMAASFLTLAITKFLLS